MRHAAFVIVVLLGQGLVATGAAAGEPMSWREYQARQSGGPAAGGSAPPASAAESTAEPKSAAPKSAPPAKSAAVPDVPLPDGVPRAVKVARATAIPKCTLFVDAASKGGDGSAQKPMKTIAAAVAAAKPGAVICVAEGVYAEQIAAGEKPFTLAGGFQSGKDFRVRDSAQYVSRAKGNGSGSFLLIEDPGPQGAKLNAVDGFEITGYARAIVREFYESQRFDVTNNFIHHNACVDGGHAGAGLSLNNVSGTIKGNVISDNACARGGAIFVNDSLNKNTLLIEGNRVERNAGTDPDASHGGALYLFINKVLIRGNEIVDNTVTQWGAGLFVGAYTAGGQFTNATTEWNVYRGNKAGDSGGGFFCDEGATCASSHEIYDRNCGGNILVDGGAGGSGPTRATFDHVTNVGALEVGCEGPGTGLFVDTYEALVADSYSVTNSLFFGNAEGRDFATACDSGCAKLKVKVDTTMAETKFQNNGVPIAFGSGMVPPADPLFVDAEAGDFRLQAGSPAIGKGSGGTDLGAYGGK